MKRLLTFCLCLSISTSLFAQRQNMTQSFAKATDFGPVELHGNMTYGYIVSEEGENLKDGLLTIKATQTGTTYEMYPYSFKISGTYNASANYLKGNMNGAAKSNFSLTVTKYSRSTGTQAVTMTRTFSGAFLNGVPNGAFSVKCSTDDCSTKLTATYTKGKLTGAFSCELNDYDNLYRKVNGTLTANSKPNGSWTVADGLTTRTMQFQNGVLITQTIISKSKLNPINESTKPQIVTYAKQYAAGTITAEQLFEKGIVVIKESLPLGEYARAAILRDSGYEFENLEGYNFSYPNTIEYTTIKEAAFLTEEGIASLVATTEKYINEKKWYSTSDFYRYSVNNDAEDFLACIEFDDGTPYLMMHKDYTSLYKGGFSGGVYKDKVYITPQQMARLEAVCEAPLLNLALSYSDLLMEAVKRNYANHDKLILGAFHAWDPYRTETIIDVNMYTQQYKKQLEYAINSIEDAIKNIEQCFVPHYKYPNEYLVNKNCFYGIVKKSTIDEFKTKWPQIKVDASKYVEDAIAQLPKRAEMAKEAEAARIKAEQEAEAARIKAKQEEEAARYLKMVQPLCDFLVSNATPTSIFFDENVTWFFDASGMPEYWELDACKAFKLICPIIECEITDVKKTDNNKYEIMLKITKKGKKKTGNLTYLVPFKLNGKRISVKEMDLTKAQQIQ